MFQKLETNKCNTANIIDSRIGMPWSRASGNDFDWGSTTFSIETLRRGWSNGQLFRICLSLGGDQSLVSRILFR